MTVNYPVLYCADNAFYLDHDINKMPSRAGIPFLDMRADLLEKNQSLSTYAHHWGNDTMYSALHKYKNLDYYKANPVFVFDSLYEEGVFKIFAVLFMAGNASDGLFYNFMASHFDDDDGFMNHVDQLKVRSIFITTVDVIPEDQLVLMTTCTYETDNLRLVIAGRKVRPGEPIEVDTEHALLNPEPLYPQKWYDSRGGHPPNTLEL
jgi:SrtB family sortase